MKKWIASIIFLIVPLTLVDGAEHSLTFSMTDNYVLRGITQTDDKASIQADYLISGLKDSGYYVGLFASNVTQGAEIDLYGGLKFTLDSYPGIIFDVGAVEYFFTDINFAPISHEFFYGLAYKESYLKFYYGEGDAHYLDVGTSLNIAEGLSAEVHYGHTFGSTILGQDIRAGLKYALDGMILSATYSIEERTVAQESHIYFSLQKPFD